jgi:putative two-component system response regulator
LSLQILLVEDSATKAMRNRTILELAGFGVTTAADGEEALDRARAHPPDAVVSDVQMPRMDGFQLVRALRQDPVFDTVPILLLTEAFPEAEDESLGLRAGADAYIRSSDAGPVTLVTTVREAITRRLNRRAAPTAIIDEDAFHRSHADRLRGHLIVKVDELRDAYHALAVAYDHTLEAFVAALDLRERGTALHSWRVSEYSLTLARRLGLPSEELIHLERGALLHDIGMIGISDAILRKPDALDDAEWEQVHKHPALGYELLEGVEFLREALDVVLHHHERWDGSGYPSGLEGEAIPVGARIFAVAEALDALTSERWYKAAVPFPDALREVESGSGTSFDPEVVKAAVAISVGDWESTRDHVDKQRQQRKAGREQSPSGSVLWSEPA